MVWPSASVAWHPTQGSNHFNGLESRGAHGISRLTHEGRNRVTGMHPVILLGLFKHFAQVLAGTKRAIEQQRFRFRARDLLNSIDHPRIAIWREDLQKFEKNGAAKNDHTNEPITTRIPAPKQKGSELQMRRHVRLQQRGQAQLPLILAAGAQEIA